MRLQEVKSRCDTRVARLQCAVPTLMAARCAFGSAPAGLLQCLPGVPRASPPPKPGRIPPSVYSGLSVVSGVALALCGGTCLMLL